MDICDVPHIPSSNVAPKRDKILDPLELSKMISDIVFKCLFSCMYSYSTYYVVMDIEGRWQWEAYGDNVRKASRAM